MRGGNAAVRRGAPQGGDTAIYGSEGVSLSTSAAHNPVPKRAL